jgi:hypothetical protein
VTQRLHDTPWRQGHVISDDTAKALNLFHPEYPAETAVVVISHDCDLAADSSIEPFCEVIVGRKISDQDGNFTRAKSVRKLHLNFTGGCVACVIELETQRKRLLPKTDLVNHIPNISIVLNEDQKTTLQAWISARYARASFPNEFDRRLTKQANRSYKKIVKVLEKNDPHLRAVYFDVDDSERDGPTDVYPLTIYLVYDAETDAIKSKAAASKAAAEIVTIFDDEFKQNGAWSNIELVECNPVSENAMSLRAARYAKRWHVDYISLAK